MSAGAEVGTRAAEVAELAAHGGAWLAANPRISRQDPISATREFRRYARRAERLRVAADRPMCVAVFGASQAGKSYLVSRLAAPVGQPLMTKLGDRALNFLSDINPPGGQEATGLVTRFTLRVPAGPPDAPVALRLLSQTDLIKIFANTFLEDFDIDVALPDDTALERDFERFSRSAGPGPRDGLTGDDVEDLVEYFERHFRNHALIQALNRVGFWPRVVDLAPRLPAPERAALFAPLWSGNAQFTETCRSMIQALQTLSFPETAFCGLDALVPRETSIVDVRMLFGLGGPPGESLRVTPVGGTPGQVSRVLLTALVAEITVPLVNKPWAFFDHTDLLDFPGARTREVIDDIDKFLGQPEKLGRAFLRGKVAYLFQRYNAEQEITSMLLCVGPSNQEVQTLPRMVQDWIDLTIGGTPEARARQPNSLFLVLTKFDAEFEDKAGEDVGSGTRWTARLQASLLDFFGKTQDWPRAWIPGKRFDNTFWLRNPAIGFDAVFDYDLPSASGEQRRELGVSPRAGDAVAARRAAYLGNEFVRQYIATPDEAWDEALRPNDGGITRLAGALAPVCDPALKAGQVSARTEELARVVADRLRPYYRSDNREAEIARARLQAGEVVKRLVDSARIQRFGGFLHALQITTEEIAAIHWQMETEPGEEPIPIGAVNVKGDYEDILSGILSETTAAEQSAHPTSRDRFERFADLVLGAWDQKRLQAFASDPATHTFFRLPPEYAAILVGQLSVAARRIDLRGRIAAALRQRAIFGGRVTAGRSKAELVVEEAINGFVNYLGFDQLPETRRPQAPGGRRVFSERPTIRGLPPLGVAPTPYDFTFQTDWMRAFARLMEDNVSDPTGFEVDRETNDALGILIKRLAVRDNG